MKPLSTFKRSFEDALSLQQSGNHIGKTEVWCLDVDERKKHMGFELPNGTSAFSELENQKT